MKQFLSFVRKEFYHIFRDKRTILILFAMPVVQILLFGFAITNEVKNTPIAIVDPSKDVETQEIIRHFEASKYFYVVDELQNIRQVDNAFKKGRISLAVIFSENFGTNAQRNGEASVQLITDGTEPNQASMIVNYATGILKQTSVSASKPQFAIVPAIHMLYNPQGKSSYNFVPGVMGMVLMLICAMMTAISIVREKETGTMEVLLASPMKPIFIILAKAVPYFILSVGNLASILLLSVFVLQVPVAGSLFWLAFISLIFIFVALALGLLISTVVESQMAAMLVSGMGLMMPVMILSGMMFPIESMPNVLQWISALVPARWYISAVRKIMIQGVGIENAWLELTVLFVMAIFLILLSLKKFKVRLN